MESTERGGKSIPCPSESAWLDVAAGITQPGESSKMLEHAAGCSACAAVLKESLQLMDSEVTAAEAAAVRALPSSDPGWQRQLAATIAWQAAARPRPMWRVWVAAAAMLVAAAGLTLMLRGRRPATPERELTEIAAAYSAARPFDFRLGGAAYGPVRVQRGGTTAPNSANLLDAEVRIAQRLESAPGDPQWTRAQGRADLLEGRYDAAIQELEAARSKFSTPDTLNELAIAHLMRAQIGRDTAEMAAATALLDEALTAEPANPVYLFNRALAHEIAGARDTESDWRALLEKEPSGGWAEEAREHLRRLEQNKQ